MKTSSIIAAIALSVPAIAAPACIVDKTSCPGLNGLKLSSNNNLVYKITCGHDLSTKVIRVTTTEIGIQGCLTACDGTIGCTAVSYVPSAADEKVGTCYSRKRGTLCEADDEDVAVAILVSGGATTTLSSYPTATTYTYTSSATPSATSSDAAVPTEWNAVAIRSGSDLQYSSINANGNSFWIGKDSAVYCPGIDAFTCPNTTSTIFTGGTSGLALDVVTPGGQEVYVDSTGALKYTVAHSGVTGDGSSTTGFSVVDNGLHLLFNGSDFYACPSGSSTVYQIYAAGAIVSAANSTCIGFEWRISETNATIVWSYS